MTILTKRVENPLPSSRVRCLLTWTAEVRPYDVDLCALLLDESGAVTGNPDFVFYNQPLHPSGAVTHNGRVGTREQLTLDLAGIPERVVKILVVAAISDGAFADVPGIAVQLVEASTGAQLRRSEPARSGTETVLIAAELQRVWAVWQFRPLWQAWEAGLADLVVHFGVDLEPVAAGDVVGAPDAEVVVSEPDAVVPDAVVPDAVVPDAEPVAPEPAPEVDIADAAPTAAVPEVLELLDVPDVPEVPEEPEAADPLPEPEVVVPEAEVVTSEFETAPGAEGAVTAVLSNLPAEGLPDPQPDGPAEPRAEQTETSQDVVPEPARDAVTPTSASVRDTADREVDAARPRIIRTGAPPGSPTIDAAPVPIAGGVAVVLSGERSMPPSLWVRVRQTGAVDPLRVRVCVLAYDIEGNPVEPIGWTVASILDGSVRMVLAGIGGTGDSAAAVQFRLGDVPTGVAALVLAIVSHGGEPLTATEAFVSEVLDDDGHVLARYECPAPDASALLLASLARDLHGTWVLRALGIPAHGRGPQSLGGPGVWALVG